MSVAGGITDKISQQPDTDLRWTQGLVGIRLPQVTKYIVECSATEDKCRFWHIFYKHKTLTMD